MGINRRELERYPYLLGKKGICFAKIDETIGIKTVGSFTESGRHIEARLQPYGIQICDYSTLPLALFRGSELASSVSDLGVVSFSLFTSLCGIFHHPDMYASYFVNMSLSFFESNGYETKEWQDVWYPYSVNYARYIRARRKGLSEIESAEQTWSGRMARLNKFKPVGEGYPGYKQEDAVIFRFKRY